MQRVFSSFASSPFSCWRYDVFLSFRGEDTHKSFTDHLCAALNGKGINVFRDDNQIERGKSICLELFNAIEESRFSVVVFSKTYANSTWCLEELVKIVECQNIHHEQIIFPIFYNVEPTVVRKQTGDFQKAFAKHEDTFKENIKKVNKWRDALKEVANISGWELKNKSESKFIEDIVNEISSKLIPSKFATFEELVGLNSRLEEFMLLLDKQSENVRMIGICGMGGLGKTTIARVVYDLISFEFEGSSFLADVRETCERRGIISLQKQLLFELKLIDGNIWNVRSGINMIRTRLRRKKVLLVIDDVVNVEQLESLAGKHDWFGSGSRIIITSRDKHLLMTHGVEEVYKLKVLNADDSLQLFCMNAFKVHKPLKEYVQLSKLVLEYANGLPLALKVLGSFLYGRTVEEWESSLQRLKRDSANEIRNVLQLSFDGLEEVDKKIFLDIACFFKGKNKDYIIKILKGCDFDPIIGIHILIEKSLISIENNKVWMHDLLQEMGHRIVKRESKDPGKRSRLWEEADVHHVLSKNKGTEEIEGIIVNSSEDKAYASADAKAFSKMTNLRLLKIHNVEVPEGLEYLSNELRLLDWHGYPLEFLPSILQVDKIIELSICYSHIKQMLTINKPLNNMKFMRFSHSKNLITTPDFTRLPNLEELDLEGCARLCEIHPSLLLHKKLIFLSLKDCTSLTTLPSKIAMESLTTLVLSGCTRLRNFPEIVGGMEYLSELLLDGTAIKELPLSVELLSGLVLLNLKDCKNLKSLPCVVINGLKRLKILNLSGCSKLENVPENLGIVESLEELDISGTAIRQPQPSIFLLKNLKALSCGGFKGTSASRSWLSRFPITLKPRRNLEPMSLTLTSLSRLCSLKKLDLTDSNLGEGAIPIDICNLLSLEDLNLSKNNFVSLPGTINCLSNLRSLTLEGCNRLLSLPNLPSGKVKVRANDWISREELYEECYLYLNCRNCLELVSNQDLAFSMLKEFVEAESNPRIEFNMIVPGSKIPEWFRYQNEGCSITIRRPPNSYYNKNKLVGYVICSVFYVQKHLPAARRCPSEGKFTLDCRMTIDKIKSPVRCFIDFYEQLGQPVSNHLGLIYLPNQMLDYFRWNFDSNHVVLSFEPEPNSSPGLEVKRCGVHPVYVDEIEKFSNTTKEWRRFKVWNINESDYDVFAGSKMDVATTSKPGLTDYTGVETSGSDDEPQSK